MAGGIIAGIVGAFTEATHGIAKGFDDAAAIMGAPPLIRSFTGSLVGATQWAVNGMENLVGSEVEGSKVAGTAVGLGMMERFSNYLSPRTPVVEEGKKLGLNADFHNYGVNEDLSKPNSVSMTEIGNVMQSQGPNTQNFDRILEGAGFNR